MLTDFKDEVQLLGGLISIQQQVVAENQAAYSTAKKYNEAVSGVSALKETQTEAMGFREQRLVASETILKILRGHLEGLLQLKAEAKAQYKVLYSVKEEE